MTTLKFPRFLAEFYGKCCAFLNKEMLFSNSKIQVQTCAVYCLHSKDISEAIMLHSPKLENLETLSFESNSRSVLKQDVYKVNGVTNSGNGCKRTQTITGCCFSPTKTNLLYSQKT